MGLMEARYFVEHKYLPEFFYEDKDDFVEAVLDDERNFVYEFMRQVFDDEEVEFPYSESQFTCRLKQTKDGVIL
jgi:hypothetical protein